MVLIAMHLLLLLGGWDRRDRRTKVRWAIALLVLAALLAFPTVREDRVALYAAENALLLYLLVTEQTAHPIRTVLYAVLTGIVGWRLIDRFPTAEPGVWMILPAVAFAALVRQSDSERALLLALSPYVSTFCVTLMDQFLFGYSVLHIGTEAGTSATLFGLFAISLLIEAKEFFRRFRPILPRVLPLGRKENS